jgi:type I restriction enzyme, S subunit
MKQAWPQVCLSDVLTQVQRDEAPVSGKNYRQIGVRLWGQGAYERESIDGSQTQYAKLFEARAGDIVVNKIWARNGSVAVVSDALNGTWGSTEFPLFEPDRARLNPRWMHWITRAPWFWSACDEHAQGTSGKNRIKPDQFLGIEIPLPPLDVQKNIIARIDTIQQQLQATAKLRISIEDQLQSLFLSLHHDSGTTSKLGDLIELHEDKEKVQPSESYLQVGVRGFGGGLFPKAAVSGTETTYKLFNRLYTDAIVLSQVKGWEGAIAICPTALSGMYVSPEYRTFRCKPNLASPSYMQVVIQSQWFWKYLKEATRGVGARRERVRPEKFLAIELHMPSYARQEMIVSTLHALQNARRLRGDAQASIDAFLPSVLQKVMCQSKIAE